MRNSTAHLGACESRGASAGGAVRDFAEKYREYYPRVFAYVYGHTRDRDVALDVTSEIFERAFVKGSSLRSDGGFASWLFVVARNTVAAYWRARKRQPIDADTGHERIGLEASSPETRLEEREEIAKLLRLVDQLRGRDKEVLLLKFDAELATAEIAQVLGLSQAHVRVILARTLQKLRRQMREPA